MFPRLILALLLLGVAGCAKPDLPDLVIRSGSNGELTQFRAELGQRFSAEQLRAFDTAVQELKLDAMNRNVTSSAAREEDMQAVINGKTVHAATILGWEARRYRLLNEIAQMSEFLERDTKLKEASGATGASIAVRTRLANEQDILARLRGNLEDTETKLAAWKAAGKTPGP